MKNFYKIGMLAVAALAFAGCAKEINSPIEEPMGTHTISFKVEKLDSKTAVEEGESVASYIWSDNDNQYFHIYENGKEATSISMTLSADSKIATFTATFANTSATEFTYRATYGSDLAGNSPYNPLIPSSQSPLLGSFDPAADILVSAEDIVLDEAADENTEFLFKLKRVVSANKMTLKGLTEGETIKTVVLRSSDSYFASRYKINDGSYTGSSKELTFDFTESENATVGLDGTFPVYFTSAPVTDASFSVIVTTNEHIYTRDNFTSKLTLAVGAFRRFGINLSGYGEEISEGIVYTLVESQEELYDGATYIIAATDDNVVMGLYAGGNNHPVVTANKSTDTASGKSIITVDNTIEVEPITITSNGSTWYLKNAASGNAYEGQYLVCAIGDKDNKLTETNSEENVLKDWNISVSNGSATIINANSGAARSRIFYNNNNSVFACYQPASTDYKGISLYVDKSTCVPHPRIIVTPSTITGVSSLGIEDASDITFILKDLEGTVDVTCDGTVVTEAVDVDNTIVYTVSPNTGAQREGWIKIAVGEIDATIPVIQTAVIEEITIAEFLNKVVGDTYYRLTGTVTNLVNDTYGNFTLVDETGEVYVYGLTKNKVTTNDKSFGSLGIVEGDIVTLEGKRAAYNDTPQVGGPAYHISHTSAPSLNVDVSNLVFNAEGETKTVVVTANNFSGSVSFSAESNNEHFTVTVSENTIVITAAENMGNEVQTGEITITATSGDETASATVTVSQDVVQEDHTYFLETFNDLTGTGGRDNQFSGSVAGAPFKADSETDETWTSYKNTYEALQSAKLGTSSNNSELTSTTIILTGSAKLYFEAAGWASDTNTLTVTASGGTLSGDTNITLTNSTWTAYNATITGATGSVTLTFSGKRLFLDNVIVYTGNLPTIPAPKADPEISFATPSYSFTLNDDEYQAFSGQIVTNPHNLDVTYSLTGDAIGTLDESTGALTLDEETTGTATITATFDGNDNYKAANVSYTVTVISGSGGVVYTLTPAAGSNNNYASNCDIAINGITWNVTGNAQITPWRIGGKSISSVDRAVYSKTAMSYNISKIDITHGAASSITVNSMTVIVATDANFTNVVSTLNPTFVANNTVTVERPAGANWSNCYYKFVYNVTVTGSNNKFIEFSKVEFTGQSL